MSAGLKGPKGTLRELERTIKSELPRTLALQVAKACAGVISKMSRATFNASEDSFGAPWQLSDDGDTVTLKKSGDLSKGVDYVAIGANLRAKLGPRYSKYQVGLRPVFPRSGLPRSYVKAIDKVSREIISARLGSV